MDTLAPRFPDRFELLRPQPVEMPMLAGRSIEHFDVVGHIDQRQLTVLVDALLDLLVLQTAEDHDGISSAAPFPAHTRFKMIRATEAPAGLACILRALVRVNQRAAWPRSADGGEQCIEHEIAVDSPICGPGHNRA